MGETQRWEKHRDREKHRERRYIGIGRHTGVGETQVQQENIFLARKTNVIKKCFGI